MTKEVVISNSCELSNNEILFLRYLCKTSLELSQFPKYWHYQYNLNAKETAEKLLENGYVSLPNIEQILQKQTVANLSNFLKKNNLSKTGKKQTLVERIINNTADDECKKHFPPTFFVSTPKAIPLLKKGDFLYYFHDNQGFNISFDDALKTKDLYPEFDENSISFYLLNKQLIVHREDENWGIYCSTLRNIYYVCIKTGKNIIAIGCLLEMTFIELNGLYNSGYRDTKKDAIKFVNETNIIKSIYVQKEELNLSYKELENILIERTQSIPIPEPYYTQAQVLQYIKSNFAKLKELNI